MYRARMHRVSIAAVALFAAALGCSAGGCAAVQPPVKPVDPVPVYLTNYGIHSSLILPEQDRREFVEYAFGDWGYAVLNHDGPFDAIGALVVSEGSGFGKRTIAADGSDRPNFSGAAQQPAMHLIYASRKDVNELLGELEERYRGGGKPILNPASGMAFVPDSQHYSILNNCNHLTARCLAILGCKIGGVVVTSNFAVANPGKVTKSPKGW